MTYQTMSDYYAAADFLPTHGRFTTEADLAKHVAFRRDFLNQKLYLPERIFWNAELIEFGPDTGENALAFAKFGAALTLVEPNPAAQKVLLEYFKRYGLAQRLTGLYSEDLAKFALRPTHNGRYDMVVAEGFVYTVQPSSLWINLFSRLLKPGGMALISYYERSGGYVELLTKKAYNRVKALTGWPPLKVAQEMFTPKWNSIPHMRSMSQWTFDVLENPFVDACYFLDAEQLCQDFESANMRLYSSWPVYRNALDCYWHKLPEQPGRRKVWIEYQRDKWMYGDVRGARLSMMRLEALLNGNDAEAIINFCRTDGPWIASWGQPNHFAVFQKNYA